MLELLASPPLSSPTESTNSNSFFSQLTNSKCDKLWPQSKVQVGIMIIQKSKNMCICIKIFLLFHPKKNCFYIL